MNLKNYIADIADFPKPGILFRDISPLLADSRAREYAIETFTSFIEELEINCIAGIDSRGFIFGSLLAQKHKLPFVMIRKAGKLPGEIAHQEYELEYGTDSLEVQKDSFSEEYKVLIMDDVLATGGTMKASIDLINKTSAEVVGAACLIELEFLEGRKKLRDTPFYSPITYA